MLERLTEPIRVLWLIKGLGPGGAEHLLVAAARARDRSLVSVEAAYLLPWKDALVPRLEAEGVAVRCLGVRDERDLRWVLRLRRRLRREPVDVVHCHSPYVAALTRLAVRSLPRAARPRVVTTEHNAWSGFRGPTRWLNAATARFDDATIAVSEDARRSMSPAVRARCEVLVHGIDTASVAAHLEQRSATRAELGIEPDDVVIGTVANYHPKKDWPNLLAAVAIVVREEPTARAVLIGQGPLEDEVHEHAAALGLDPARVQLPGFRPDAVRLMAACDVFTLASQWEGLPVALMEACALGRALVVTAVGGIPVALRADDDARLVAPKDPEALAAALLDVVRDPELRARLAAAAAARAVDFDASRAQRRIEAVYAEVVAR
jgi:glycosyltransferase involved in cell wall biosynthesis